MYLSQDNDKNISDSMEKIKNGRFKSVFNDSKFNSFMNELPFRIDINNSFIYITTETHFLGRASSEFHMKTEKTYKPIMLCMPFIMVGNYHSLKCLKEDGYQTFSKWWSEDYDNIISPVKRIDLFHN